MSHSLSQVGLLIVGQASVDQQRFLYIPGHSVGFSESGCQRCHSAPHRPVDPGNEACFSAPDCAFYPSLGQRKS